MELDAVVGGVGGEAPPGRVPTSDHLAEVGARRLGDVRATLETKLVQMQQTNAAKLDEMRKTVDEKLQTTLETRLPVSDSGSGGANSAPASSSGSSWCPAPFRAPFEAPFEPCA